MKKTLFLFFALLIVITSCEKKKQSTSCYQCNVYKVVYSNIASLSRASYLYGIDTVCNLNDGTYNLYVQMHTYNDTTVFNSDTFVYTRNSVQCNPE
jgi:hypothetical protein